MLTICLENVANITNEVYLFINLIAKYCVNLPGLLHYGRVDFSLTTYILCLVNSRSAAQVSVVQSVSVLQYVIKTVICT